MSLRVFLIVLILLVDLSLSYWFVFFPPSVTFLLIFHSFQIMHKERFFPMTAVDPHHDTAKGVLKSSFELLRLIEGCRHSVVYRDQIGRAAGSALAVNNLPFLRALLKEWRQWAGHQTVLHPKKRTTQQLCYLLSDVRKVQRAIEVLSDAVLKTAAHSGNMTGSSITLSNIDFGVDQELFETRVLEGRLIDCLREDSLRLSKDLWSALPKQYFKSKDIGLGVETSVNEVCLSLCIDGIY